MATLVFLHAHPDDEAIITGGTIARASDEGHRVVLVVATDGRHGEVEDGFLPEGESLAQRREMETFAAARILGVARVEFLRYHDSGMMGTPPNDSPEAFWGADVEEAARRVADVLREESADVLVCYDDHGGYGHPDHIQVHRVGHRAAALAGVGRLYEATINRDRVLALRGDGEGPSDEDRPNIEQIGTPDAEITTRVDVTPYLEVKRTAMRAHASQIAETSWFLAMEPDLFATVWGTEWYLRSDADPAVRASWLLD